MYPSCCRFRPDPAHDDPRLAAVAADFGLGGLRPGLALREVGGKIEVLAASDGSTVLLPAAAVIAGLSEGAALGLMDALEEALEDARESGAASAEVMARMESALGLLERCLGDDEMGGV